MPNSRKPDSLLEKNTEKRIKFPTVCSWRWLKITLDDRKPYQMTTLIKRNILLLQNDTSQPMGKKSGKISNAI